MLVFSAVKRSSSWAADLVHPVPLASVGLLAFNDHFLKGSGLLPGAITGKISDFAGLFFFPLLLASIANGLYRIGSGRNIQDRRSLAAAMAIITALGFAAVKLIGSVNELVASTWGKMVMDPTDLVALPMVGLAAFWMLRHAGKKAPGEVRTDRRVALDFAGVLAAAVASIATSQAPPPAPPPPPPQPAPVAVAEDPSCADLTVDTCERTANQTLVVVRAVSRYGDMCKLDILRAEEASSDGHTSADVLPKNIVLQGQESKTFALTFIRPVSLYDRSAALNARAQIGVTAKSGAQHIDEAQFSGGCAAR